MPNRIIREAILTSERVASLDWPSEVFYRRLLSIVDDYGRIEAGHQLLRAKCYPLQTDSVRVADIARWMAACQKSGLILVYGVNGKQYLEVSDFGQQIRSASKCPAPDSNCNHLLADAHLGVSVVVSVSEEELGASPSAPPAANDGQKTKSGSRLPAGWVLPDDWADWARKERPDLHPAQQAERFADYWHGIPGAKGRKTDWLATWRNWIRNEKRAGGNFPQPAVTHRSVEQTRADMDAVKPRRVASNEVALNAIDAAKAALRGGG